MSGFSSAGGSGSAPANPGDRRPLPASGLAAPSAPSAPALGPPPVPRFAPVSGAVPASRPSAATAGLSSSGTKKGRGKAPATPLPSIADHRSEEARVEFAGLDKKLDKIMSSLVGAVRTFRGLDSKLSPMVEGVDARIEAAEAKIASFAEELQLLKDAVAAGAAGTGPLPSAVAPTKRRQQDDDATMSGVPDFDNITNAPLPMAGEMNLQKFKDGIMETVDELMATTMTGIFDWTRGEIGRRINTASMSVACVAKLGGDQSRTPLEEAQLAMIERLQQNLDAYSTQHQEVCFLLLSGLIPAGTNISCPSSCANTKAPSRSTPTR